MAVDTAIKASSTDALIPALIANPVLVNRDRHASAPATAYRKELVDEKF